MKKNHFTILIFSLFIFACEDEVQIIDLSEPRLLDDGKIELNWTAINIESDHEKFFYIMRAEDNNPYQTIKTITNYYNTPRKKFHFTDDDYSLECDSVRYQITHSDKHLSSQQVTVMVPKPIKLPDNPNRYSASIYKVIQELNYILMFETGGGVSKIHTYI